MLTRNSWLFLGSRSLRRNTLPNFVEDSLRKVVVLEQCQSRSKNSSFFLSHADRLPQQVSEVRFVHPKVAETPLSVEAQLWQAASCLSMARDSEQLLLQRLHSTHHHIALHAPCSESVGAFLPCASFLPTPVTGATRWPAVVHSTVLA